MPSVPLREKIFDAGCFLAGRLVRAFDQQLTRPVIMIGTGRCGTSLLVKVLKSHPAVAGFPGEANELWHPALEPFESADLPTPPIEVDPQTFTQVSLTHWPPHHGERIRDVFTGFHLLSGRSKVFLTKSAMLSFMVPRMLQLFPDARIIHIYRFGPSVVKSYVKKNLGKYARFPYPEPEYREICARYWNTCILEIDAQTKALSADRFLEFSYEELCLHPRAVLGNVARLLGISPERFGFDITALANQNFKAENDRANPERAHLLALMAPGLTLKGYSSVGVIAPARPGVSLAPNPPS